MKTYITYILICLSSVAVTWMLAAKHYNTNSVIINNENITLTNESSPAENRQGFKRNSEALNFLESNRRISLDTANREIDVNDLLSPLQQQIDFSNEEFIIKNVRAMTLFIEECSEDEILSIINNTEREGNENWNILHLLAFSKLADFNPEKALALSQELNFESEMLRPEFIDNWSLKKPHEALAYLLNNNTREEDHSFSIVFKNLSRKNYQEALLELSKVNKENKSYALEGIASTLSSTEEFTNLITYAEIDEENNEQMVSIINEWALKSPLDAIDWSRSQDNADYIEQIQYTWLQNDPENAANWVLENSTNNAEALNKIVGNWDYDRPQELLKFLDQQPPNQNLDKAYLQLITEGNYYEHEEVLGRINSKEIRKKAVASIYEELINSDSESAALFLKNNKDLNEDEKLELSSKEPEELDLVE